MDSRFMRTSGGQGLSVGAVLVHSSAGVSNSLRLEPCRFDEDKVRPCETGFGGI